MNTYIGMVHIDYNLELSYTKSGRPYVNFEMKVLRGGKTNKLPAVAFDDVAESLTQFAGRGSEIIVTAEPELRRFRDKDKVPYVNFVILSWEFTHGKYNDHS